jgi:hypothetical protein
MVRGRRRLGQRVLVGGGGADPRERPVDAHDEVRHAPQMIALGVGCGADDALAQGTVAQLEELLVGEPQPVVVRRVAPPGFLAAVAPLAGPLTASVRAVFA